MSKRKPLESLELPELLPREVQRLMNRHGSGGRMERNPRRGPWSNNKLITRRIVTPKIDMNEIMKKNNNTKNESTSNINVNCNYNIDNCATR